MEVFELLEEIESLIEDGKSIPFTAKRLIDVEVLEQILEEIKNKMPDEMKQAKWIKEERTRILQEANKEAEDIVKEAENRIIEMIDEHEITKQAYLRQDQIIDEAKRHSREITEGTKVYTDEILSEAEAKIKDLSEHLNESQNLINSALNTLKENRNEFK